MTTVSLFNINIITKCLSILYDIIVLSRYFVNRQDSMIEGADSDKSSSGRKLLFHEALGLEKKHLLIMEKK